MKLSTLLLSSAALVVAGSAFAADLPAKKGAPAAKATGCPSFGAGFFQIPGGDTCIKFSGYMNYNGTYVATDGTHTQAGGFRLLTDVRSNSEMGVVRGVARLDASSAAASVSRAYAQLGGLTAGHNASLLDIAGTNPWNYGASLGAGARAQVSYAMSIGSGTLTVGQQEAATLTSGANAAKRPDLVIKYEGSAGPANVVIGAVSHEAVSSGAQSATQGYAVVGRLGASMGNGLSAAVFGGSSSGASLYTATTTTNGSITNDYDGTNTSTGTNAGGELLFSAGGGTLGLNASQQTTKMGGTSQTATTYGVDYVYTVAKNFVVEPEYINQTIDGTVSNTVYLRISRDF
jgi:hypothetical protein